MKRVAVQNDLIEIRKALEARGYIVVDFTDESHVDAIVYTENLSGIESLNSNGLNNEIGAVLINAKNKQIEEIEYIIETRRYGSLF
ncbi:YkuS family protein [Alkaliphilus transvaalensis]|uniref:YkuS family protein n=1 Tax=Alkaliphilus transvaalensis TaxID=114628 RepID=UPI00047C3117|nr:YkuS family protein [Alkaliphilus transvaalensis]